MSPFDLGSWIRKGSASNEEERKFIRVGRTGDLPPGKARTVTVMGRDVGLFNCSGTYKAVENACPHNNRPIGTVEFDDDHVTCLWHGLRFSFQTGVCPEAEHYQVLTYEVKVIDDEIWVSTLPGDLTRRGGHD